MKKNGKRPHPKSNGHRPLPARVTKLVTEDSVLDVPLRDGRNGGKLRTGNPGNGGGGRQTAIRERLEILAAEKSLDLIEKMHGGEIVYHFHGVCSKCGAASTGPSEFPDVLKMVPSPDVRLRAGELPLKYTLGRERVIRVEGFPGAQRAFDVIRSRIRQKLGADVAEELLTDIQLSLKEI